MTDCLAKYIIISFFIKINQFSKLIINIHKHEEKQ